MKLLSVLALGPMAYGAVTLSVVGVTQTQAVLQERGYSGACTIQISTDPTFTSPATIYDFNGAEYSGASTDTGRPDTITLADGTRLVTIGHMNDDRALAEETTYYVSVSACGSASARFTTVAPSNGTGTAWPVPFNSSKWGNRGWPYTLANALDAKGTQYIDPLTGVKLTAVNTANDFTWRYPGAGHFPVSPGTMSFSYYSGGAGWSNPANVVNGATSTASTSADSPIDLYPGASGGNGPWWNYWTATNDLGVKIWAGCSVSGGCPFTMCVFTNPATGCLGTPIGITAPQGSMVLVASSSSDPDTPWPSSFPSALFSGWGPGAMIGQENQPTASNCTLSASSGVLTVDSGFLGSSACAFNLALGTPGNRIYIAGSSPTCTNNLCTVESLTNAYSLTTVESVTAPAGTSYTVLGWGVRIVPALTSGTLTIGAAYKQAGTEQPGQPGAGPNADCSPQTFTSSQGKQMRLCTVYGANSGQYYLWGFTQDGVSLPLWVGKIPSTSYFTGLGFASNDIPQTCCGVDFWQFRPGTDAHTWYLYQNTQNNGSLYELYKLTYTGSGSEGLTAFGYTLDPANAGIGPVRNVPSDYWTWSALTPGSSSLAAQIATFYPSYNASLFGNSFSLSSLAGTGAYFQNTYGGQNYGAWIAIIDLGTTPATLSNLIHTVDGTGTNGHMRFGGLHNVSAYPAVSPSPTAAITNNPLYGNNSSLLFGGPFEMPVAAVSRGGVWDTNTCLDWPIGGGSGFCPSAQETYDSTCPAGNPYQFIGATGNQCVKMRVPKGGWCNKVPNAAESAWPCPAPGSAMSGWNYSSYSQPFPLAVGDNFVFDMNGDGSGDPLDQEHLRVVATDSVGDPGWLDIWVQRNAMWDYCGYNDPVNRPGNTGLDSANQMRHASGIQAFAAPPYLNGCNTGVFLVSGKTQSGQTLVEVGRSLQGHGDLTPGESPGTVAWLSANSTTRQGSLTSVFAVPPPPQIQGLASPTFAGTSLPIGNGNIQAYVSTPGGVPWFADSNTLNNNYGTGGLSARSLTHVSGNIYLIQALGTSNNTNYKEFPMLGWAGRNVLLDVSGPSSAGTLAATSYGMCYAYNANECVAGSAAGSVYVNVPFMWDNGSCQAGQTWYNSPCVILGWPGTGGYRQMGWDRPDMQGTRSRFLTYGFGGPGMATPYAEMEPISSTQAFLPPVINTPFGNVAWLVQLPTWTEDRSNRTIGGGLKVQAPAGNAYARVHFGYSRFIGAVGSPGNFYCSGRAEACNTSGSPYSFDSEISSGTACLSGCAITVPAMAPNLVYWQIQVSSNGTAWTNWGDIQASTVQ
jgi:hypothetical protein